MKRIEKEIWKELKKVGYKRCFLFGRPTINEVVDWLRDNGVHISLLYTNIIDKWGVQIQLRRKATERVFWYSIPTYTNWNDEDYDVALKNAIVNAIDAYKKNFLK